MHVHHCSKAFTDLECVFINELLSMQLQVYKYRSKTRNAVLNLSLIYIFKVTYHIITVTLSFYNVLQISVTMLFVFEKSRRMIYNALTTDKCTGRYVSDGGMFNLSPE